MNKKGFSLIELLAVIVILGIIMTVATIGVIKYLEQSRKQAYDTMEKSSYDAARNYLMEQSIITYPLTLKIEDLVEEGYLEALEDPVNKGRICKGNVVIEKVDDEDPISTNALEELKYTINVECSKYQSNNVVYPKK